MLLGATLIGGVIFTFLNLSQLNTLSIAGIIGFIHAFLLVIFVAGMHQLLGDKLRVFNLHQQWFLRAIFYAIALIAAFLFGLFIKAQILHDSLFSIGGVYEFFWISLSDFIQNPGQEIEFSRFVHPAVQQSVWTFMAIMLLFSLASILGSWVQIRWQEARHSRAREQAELTALRAQMDPHFLFNTLNTITSLVKADAEKAEQLLVQLSDLLRYVFKNSAAEKVTLKEEINFTQGYLKLLQARFPDKLSIEWQQKTNDESRLVPAFILQPLIENSIRHGWQDQNVMLKIDIIIILESKNLIFKIKDNGQGLAPVMKNKFIKPGHALANLSERLVLFYHKKDLVHFDSIWRKGTTVKIRVPV